MTDIMEFQGPNRWLSNFEGPQVFYAGLWFPKVEHAYQAGKTLDSKMRIELTSSFRSASAAKKLGKSLVLRPDWNEFRLPHMWYLVRQKALDRKVLELLLETEGAFLEEGNY